MSAKFRSRDLVEGQEIPAHRTTHPSTVCVFPHVVTRMLIAGTISMATLTPSLALAPSPRADFTNSVLTAHNRERVRLGLAPLRWSPALANDARSWAKHIARMGYLKHYPDNPRDPNPQGENLWAGTRGHYAPDDMVEYWIAEKRNLRQGFVPKNSKTGDFEDVGHYTQVVWRSTKTVGCAVARGNNYDFLVCRYLEGGNVVGEKPY